MTKSAQLYSIASTLVDKIEYETRPGVMTKGEAFQVLEIIRDDLNIRLEALGDEIEDEDGS